MNTSDTPFHPESLTSPDIPPTPPPGIPIGGDSPIDTAAVSDIVNRLYHEGDQSSITREAGVLPLADRIPSMDKPDALSNRIPATPVIPMLVRIISDSDTPLVSQTSGTGTGVEVVIPAVKGSPAPMIEIPMMIPALSATNASGRGNPTTPNVIPGDTIIGDGPTAMAFSGSPSASLPAEPQVPVMESPAIPLPPMTSAFTAVPAAQVSPKLAGDSSGMPNTTIGIPPIENVAGIEKAPQNGLSDSPPFTGAVIPPLETMTTLGHPYFIRPVAVQEIAAPTLPESLSEPEIANTHYPNPPTGIPGPDLEVLTRGMSEDALLTPRLPATVTDGERYFIKERREPSAIDEPRIDQTFDMSGVRADFPILHQLVNGRPLVWLDNAATSQKPRAVIEALKNYYETINSNVHRGAHTLAARATEAYEGAREKVQRFIGAGSPEEIIFVRGTTEAINLVANSYGRNFLAPGDEVVVSTLEHHSNIVPWLMLRQSHGIIVRVAPVDDNGDLLLPEFIRLLGPRTKLVAITHVSNAIGTVMPVQEIIALAHAVGARVLIDGAQSVPHFRVNVRTLDADFYVFSSHKVFGPTGIGVLYGRKSLLDAMPPWQGGGSMIDQVSFDEVTYNKVPYKFEAGTPIIGPAVGLGAAIDYLEHIGFDRASAYEHSLLSYALRVLSALSGVRIIGNPRHRVGSISLIVEGIKTEEVGRFLDREGIAVRAGHHCAQPALRRFGLEATVRPSLAFYNTVGEIDRLVEAILKAQRELK